MTNHASFGDARPDSGAAPETDPGTERSDAAAEALEAGAAPAGELDPETLRAALDQLNDRHIRLMAEFDNFRRRSLREREAAFVTGAENLARPLLDVMDNLERAMAHSADAPPGPWIDGVALTVRQFADALRTAGIEAVEPLGEPFDPRFHEALGSAPADDVPADSVVQVVTRGYRLGDRVLRPARVIVSRAAGTPAA